MFNDLSSPATLMATRRSGKPRDLGAPGPSAEQLDRILAAATRVPDHGKLAPWRFVVVPDDKRDAFHALLERAYRAERADAGKVELEAVRMFAYQAPALVVVLSAPVLEAKIPLWEQELSAGASVMNIVTAANALGYVANWLTGWVAFDRAAMDALGLAADEKIAGFVFIGSPSRELEERPRPDMSEIVHLWNPQG